MANILSPTQVEQFRKLGCIYPIRVLALEDTTDYLKELETLERAHQGESIENLRRKVLRFKPHLLYTWMNRLVRHPRILDVVEDLIGPNILVWASAFFIKEPQDSRYVAWHQDSVTYGLEGGDLVTAWVALTDAHVENAAMRFLPGTHREGLLPHVDTWDEENDLSRGEEIKADIREEEAVDVVLDAGEMSLHHLDLVHSSPPNHSDRRRVGYAIRYLPPQVHHRSGQASAMLVRGQDQCGHFELEPAPQRDADEIARAAHARAMRIRMAQVFEESPANRS